MTKSVQQVAAERPQVVRLTFVISRNLNTGTAKGTRKSERDKFLDKVDVWKPSIAGADRIQFELVQESDLLDRLVLPQHRGRVWFWWNQVVFGAEWLRSHYQQQAIVAGEKYRPDLQVDVPIANDLKALGFSKFFIEEFESVSRQTIKTINRLGRIDVEDEELNRSCQAMSKAAEQVAACLTRIAPFSTAVRNFDSLKQDAIHFMEAIEVVQARARELQFDSNESSELPTSPRTQSLNFATYHLRTMRSTIAELLRWVSEPAAQAARTRLYFLAGPAGSGKTHLFLDAVKSALDEDRPAVVLFGARFGSGNIWESVCDQLGIEPVGRDVLLGAMDSAAQAAGADDGRFVLMIDALNETLTPKFWETHLPELRAALSTHPQLALAVSCRDTYLDVVDPDAERRQFVERVHPGFAGREIEATQKYFDHYGLEAPRIPLLIPEFTVPLFLRLYCESLRNSGTSATAVGHEGRVGIFDRYLHVKAALVARAVFPLPASNFEVERNQERARAVLDALLDGMADLEVDWLSLDEAETRATSVLDGDKTLGSRVIGAFENEGLLSREPLFLLGQEGLAGIRVTFQAFSDFLLLSRRLEKSANPEEDQELRNWLLGDASWGILEAATVVLPEKYGIELSDFLGLRIHKQYPRHAASPEEYAMAAKAWRVFQSLAETLPYRTSSSIGPRTIDLLNEALAKVLSVHDFYRIMFMTAPQPESPLNGEGLHRHLSRMRLPKRDASFGFAVYDEFWDESSPLVRLARWAALGPYPAYSSHVIALAAIPLFWLLSSPNRFMRDWVAKVLVQLLHGHLDVMQTLFERFWDVDDPYIVQRVLAIAYGSVMRGGRQDLEQAGRLARAVLERVFERPIRPDALMLDAAHGIVEWAVVHDVLPVEALDAIKRPYGLKLPGYPPSLAAISERFDSDDRPSDDESYATVYSSFFGIGDFGRYVVDPNVRQFSRYPYGQEVPKRERQEPRFVKSRWTKLLRSLTDAQAQTVLKMVESESVDGYVAVLRLENGAPDVALTTEQRALLASVFTSPRSSLDDAYPTDRARRWVFMRTLSLGWTPKLFGVRDRSIDRRNPGREDHKAERWGKKYQWIALHELLARVADHFQPLREYEDEELFDGFPQMTRLRDIDPSLPPVMYRDLLEKQGLDAPTWRRAAVATPKTLAPCIEFQRYRGDVTKYLADRESEPSLPQIATFEDDVGIRWLALNGLEVQREARDDWDRRSLEQTTWLWSAFVDRNTASSFAEDLKGAWQKTFDGPEVHGHVHCCYAGEIGWTPRWCIHQLGEPRSIEEVRTNVQIFDTCEPYVWSASLDCSISDPVRGTFPSTYIQKNAKLHMITSGPSWLDEHGQLGRVCKLAVHS
jgi:hypothetical protein